MAVHLRFMAVFAAVFTMAAGLYAAGARETAATADKATPTVIRVFNRVNVDVNLENNPVLKELEKRTNTKIQYEAPPIANYTERLQLLMATQDLPDLIYNWRNADSLYEQWVKDGLLMALDGIATDASRFPNINREVTSVIWESIRSVTSGKIHMVPRPNGVGLGTMGFVINQQWLDKLGMKIPETKEQMVEVMRAFTAKDPDGNGKNDTYGASLRGFELWSELWLESAFGLFKPAAPDVDGKHKLFEKRINYLPYLRFLRSLFAERIVDPESFQNKAYDCYTKREQNRVGITYGGAINVVNAVNQRGVKDSAQRFSFGPILANDKGEHVHAQAPSIWGGWMIPEKSKQKVDALLKFLDFGHTPDTVILMMNGIQGQDYTSWDPKTQLVVRTDEQLKLYKVHASTYMAFGCTINGVFPMLEGADTPELYRKLSADLAYGKSLNAHLDMVPTLRAPKLILFPNQHPDIESKLRQSEIEFVLGKIDEAALVKYLNDVYFPAAKEAEDEYIRMYQK